MQRMSEAGIVDLIADEGEVLRAYRCPAGVWTIGVGLTAASGVVKPTSGMVITREESRRLLAEALRRNYEPTVDQAMGQVPQPAFDAGTSFHFNTGAIRRATWVGRYRAGDLAGARSAFLAWDKAGGRVLPGLAARRRREWETLSTGRYHRSKPGAPLSPSDADRAAEAQVLRLGSRGSEVEDLQRDLVALGYYAGAIDGVFGPATDQAVRRLQGDHAVLTVDGRVGPATRATIRRELDARDKLGKTGGAGGAAGGVVVGEEAAGAPVTSWLPFSPWWIVAIVVLVTLAVAGWYAWQYRDELGAMWTRWRRRRAERFAPPTPSPVEVAEASDPAPPTLPEIEGVMSALDRAALEVEREAHALGTAAVAAAVEPKPKPAPRKTARKVPAKKSAPRCRPASSAGGRRAAGAKGAAKKTAASGQRRGKQGPSP